MSQPQVSVVIPSYAGYDTLRRVLDGFERQEAAPAAFEILVAVDADDPDPDAAMRAVGERPFAVRAVRAMRPGASANRNAASAAARGPILLFTDNDTVPTSGLLSVHLDWHRRYPDPEVGVVGHVRWAPELRVTPFMRWLDRGVQFDYPSIRGIDAGWGRFYTANASVKRAFFEQVGGFDEERFPFGYEDLDWAHRADAAGFRLLYARDAVADHIRPVTLDFWKRRVRRIAAAERRFVAINPDVRPHFHRLFSAVEGQPPGRGRAVGLARWVPRGLPLLGPRIWTRADLHFRQVLAPHFLAAWNAADESAAGAVQPDVSELEESSAGSSPGGPK